MGWAAPCCSRPPMRVENSQGSGAGLFQVPEFLCLRVGVKQAVGISELFFPDDSDNVDSVVGFLEGRQIFLDSSPALAGRFVQGNHTDGDLGLDTINGDLRTSGGAHADQV